MNKVSRAEWGARPPKRVSPGINTRSATGHWEGTSMGSFPHASCATKVRVIQNYHMDTQGWNDIAYNFLVCPHNYVFVGRDHGVRSSANGSNAGNSESEAVCYLGGIGDPFTDEAKYGFSEIMHEISSVHYCHNHWFNTMCPGPEICDWIKSGMPTQMPVPKPPIVIEDEEIMPTPAVVSIDDDNTMYFVKGVDKALWAKHNTDDWFNLGGEISSGPDADKKPDGTIIVVARGKEGHTWQLVCAPDGTWGEWENMGGMS
jgi:hypothetical protein